MKHLHTFLLVIFFIIINSYISYIISDTVSKEAAYMTSIFIAALSYFLFEFIIDSIKFVKKIKLNN